MWPPSRPPDEEHSPKDAETGRLWDSNCSESVYLNESSKYLVGVLLFWVFFRI